MVSRCFAEAVVGRVADRTPSPSTRDNTLNVARIVHNSVSGRPSRLKHNINSGTAGEGRRGSGITLHLNSAPARTEGSKRLECFHRTACERVQVMVRGRLRACKRYTRTSDPSARNLRDWPRDVERFPCSAPELNSARIVLRRWCSGLPLAQKTGNDSNGRRNREC